MANLSTFYLSRIIGKRVYNAEGKKIGIVKDLLVDTLTANINDTFDKPLVIGVKTKTSKGIKIYSFEFVDVFLHIFHKDIQVWVVGLKFIAVPRPDLLRHLPFKVVFQNKGNYQIL